MAPTPLLRRLACGARLDAIARVANRKRQLIVTYHGLREDSSPARSWLLLPLSKFVAQLEYLRSHYAVMPLDSDGRNRGTDHGRAVACITFDDGYRNNFEIALPVLQRLGLPATVFLATGFMGTDRVLWTTRLELAVRQASAQAQRELADWLGIAPADGNGDRFANHVAEPFKTMRPAARDAALAEAYSRLPTPAARDFQPFQFMSWEDVRAMESTGLVTFGAHTVNHEIVRNLDDRTLHDELATSIADVNRQCESPSRTFAYPNGRAVDFDDRAEQMLREAGCTGAVSTIEGLNDHHVPPFALRRISVGAEMEFADFRLRTSGLDAQVRRLAGRPT
jgi:peptidoglycan/xylan/chitin deacetylase (PgdA/CDA1 family)